MSLGRVIGEGGFDVIYLLFAFISGMVILIGAKSWYLRLFGFMFITLSVGDAFHLIPRIFAVISGKEDDYLFSLGFGKLITSVTMTYFYLIFYFAIEMRMNIESWTLRIVCTALTIIRVLLCAFPQNEWFVRNSSVTWGIYRNIPFVILGLIIDVLCWVHYSRSRERIYIQYGLAVILSFLFYLPVVLAVHINRKIGMLMIPKTLCYIWIISLSLYQYAHSDDQEVDQSTHQKSL